MAEEEREPTEEEMQAMQERLKNMSPEEIAELQKQQCPFCQMVDGKIPVKKVYEDNTCFAILDINPASPGHVLIIPKEHYMIMQQIPEEVIGKLFDAAKNVGSAVFEALGAEGSNILVQNGAAAGQRAPHFMIHVIPRKKEDGLKIEWQPKQIEDSEMEKMRQSISEKCAQIIKPKIKEPEVLDKEVEEIKQKEGDEASENPDLERMERIP